MGIESWGCAHGLASSMNGPGRMMSRFCLKRIDVLVLAGGLGTRLRAVLGDTPKLLAPIGDRPYLAYLIDWLSHFGARRLLLGLGHRADAVRAYLDHMPATAVTIESVVEPRPLGTAGAVRFARAQLASDPVLVMNGDSFVDADLCAFLGHHRKGRALGTILCAEVENAGRYGRVTRDRTGAIAGFVEKDASYHGTALVNAGAYLLSARLLDYIATSTAASLEVDVFERLPQGALAAFVGGRTFIDIGTPDSLARASSILAGRCLEPNRRKLKRLPS